MPKIDVSDVTEWVELRARLDRLGEFECRVDAALGRPRTGEEVLALCDSLLPGEQFVVLLDELDVSLALDAIRGVIRRRMEALRESLAGLEESDHAVP